MDWSRIAAGGMFACLLFGMPHLVAAQQVSQDASIGEKTQTSMRGPMDVPQAPAIQRTVTISIKDRPLAQVVKTIAENARLRLVFDDNRSLPDTVITVTLVKVSGVAALRQVLTPVGFEARLMSDGETIVIRSSRPAAKADTTTSKIQGRVLDSTTRSGMGDVTVTVQGRKISVMTRDDGRFTLPGVPPGQHAIVFKRFGYRSVTSQVDLTADRDATLTVMMVAVPSALSEIVTTATGKQRKYEVGNSIAVINVDSVMRTAPITTVSDLLENRVPGLLVQRTGGGPGDPSVITIRGLGSIERGNEPIIIVDGIRITSDESLSSKLGESLIPNITVAGMVHGVVDAGDTRTSRLDQIDPNSIETIEIQKGPSASAMYGADAANGVIIITTKRGQPGKTTWQLSGTYGIQRLPKRYPLAYGYSGWGIGGFPLTGTQQNGKCTFPCKVIVDSIQAFQALNDPRYSVLDHGTDSRMSLGTSGGVGVFAYSVTGSMSGTSGYLRLPQVEIDRFEALHEQPVPRWAKNPRQYHAGSATANVNYRPHEQFNVMLSQSISRSLKDVSSLENAYDLHYGSGVIDTAALGRYGVFRNSPYRRSRVRNLGFKTAVASSLLARSWLPLTTTIGLDFANKNDENILVSGIDPGDSLGQFLGSNATEMTQSFMLGTGNAGITVVIGGRRVMRLAGGINMTKRARTYQTGSADSLQHGIEVAPVLDRGQQRLTNSMDAGWYVEPKFDINSRFFVVPGFRFDGSSLNGTRGGFGSFPRLSFSWLASEEPFWPHALGIDLFQLRTAFGYAGRLPANGSHLRLLDYQDVEDGQTLARLLTIGNTELVPERVREFEVGFLAEFWQNRLSLDVNYAHNVTDNAIKAVTVAPSVFGDNIRRPMNIGRTRGQSFEVSLVAKVIERRAVAFSFTTTFNRLSNILDRLNTKVPSWTPGESEYVRYVEGYPLAGIWYRPVIAYVDLNGNDIIDNTSEVQVSDSAIFAGTPEPRYVMTLSPILTLLNGRVRVNADISYKDGATRILTASDMIGCFYCSDENPDKIGLTQQALVVAKSQFPQIVNVFEFTTMSVSVSLPASLTSRLKLTQTSLSLQGRNLGVKTNYLKKDPGVGVYRSNGFAEGIPRPREWSLRVSTNL